MNTTTDRLALRFYLVSTFYPPYNFGGDWVYARRLANGPARLGHQVTVLHSPRAYGMFAGAKLSGSYDDHKKGIVRPIRTPLGKLGLLAAQQTGHPGSRFYWLENTGEDI